MELIQTLTPVINTGKKSGAGVGIFLFLLILGGIIAVGYYFYTEKQKEINQNSNKL